MHFHDDENIAVVVQETVSAIKEGARMIGKADRGITNEQIRDIEEAIGQLSKILELKRPA